MSNQNLASALLQEMEADVHKMMGMLEKLKTKVNADDLTGLLRRNEFFYRMELMRESSQGGSIALILIDIDNFKRINDLEGHVVGDHILKRVADVIHRCRKAGAEVGRFGGEEFVIGLCATEARAQILAEALRKQIQREVNVTVSVGVATAQNADKEVRRMVGAADKALYDAKQTGKNRVCLAA
ncbi:MAG: GGDEF domain-containing protein [Bdellovibrionota bacterium]